LSTPGAHADFTHARSVSLLNDEQLDQLATCHFVQGGGFSDIATLNQARLELRALQEAQRLRPAAVSRGDAKRIDATERSDLIAWVDPSEDTPALSTLHRVFESLQAQVNEGLFLGLRCFELQAAVYPGGGAHYRRHLDAFPGSENRVVTAIVYLNPDWKPEQGGELVAWAPEALTVEPRLGHWVVFLSDRIPHQVLPAHAERWALTAWFRRTPTGLTGAL
jgi:SM-20-related protein